MQETEKKFSPLWICVEEGLRGTENQLLAVAEHLSDSFKHICLRPGWLTRKIAPYAGGGRWIGITPQHAPPALVLAAGRQAVQPAIWIKKQCPDARVIFLQDPKWGHHNFDLIATPAHDQLKKGCVFETVGAATSITPAVVDATKGDWPSLGDMPGKKIAVLIGGTSKTHQLTPSTLAHILRQIEPLKASLMITASRRSGLHAFDTLTRFADYRPNTYLWDGEGENPYLAMLGHADTIMVTEDSVSMMSDAASTGKPVYTLPLEGGSAKFDRFYQNLKNQGVIRPFDGDIDTWAYTPLRDAALIAQAIKDLK